MARDEKPQVLRLVVFEYVLGIHRFLNSLSLTVEVDSSQIVFLFLSCFDIHRVPCFCCVAHPEVTGLQKGLIMTVGYLASTFVDLSDSDHTCQLCCIIVLELLKHQKPIYVNETWIQISIA